MPEFTAYLSFDGNCAEAMRFYERALNGKLVKLIKNGETPMASEFPPETHERIMHARLEFGGAVLMAGDSMLGQPYEGIKGVTLTASYDTVEEAKRVFDALADGGNVSWGFEEAFWADGAGMLTDRFGTPWIINGKLREI